MLYEFYSIGEGATQIEHIGTTNSYSTGRHRVLVSILDKLASDEQNIPIYLLYKGDPYSSKHGECSMLFIQAMGLLFSIGIRVLDEKNRSQKDVDCKRTFAEIYKWNRSSIPIVE